MLSFSALSCGLLLSPILSSSFILAFVTIFFLILARKKSSNNFILALQVLFFFQFGLIIGSFSLNEPPHSLLYKKVKNSGKKVPVWIEGKVLSSEITLDGSRAVIETEAFYDGDERIEDRIKIISYLPIEPPQPYSRFKGCFFLSLPKTKTNPGQFDYRKSLNDRGIYLNSELKEKSLYTTVSKNYFFYYLSKYKNYLRTKIVEKCKNESGIVLALLLGERGMLKDKEELALLRSGLFHLIALSGLHIGIVILIFYFLFGLMHLNPYISDILLLFFLLLYTLIVKDQPSVNRAVLMAFIFILARMAGRQNAKYAPLLISFSILIFFNPLQIRDVGFQLTFIATLGIISLYDSKIKFFRDATVLNSLFTLFWIGLSAQIFTFPVLVYAFQRINPLSFLLTPLTLPFLFPLLASGILFIFGGSLIPFFNSFLLLLIQFFAKCFLLIPLYGSKTSLSSLFFPLPHFFYALVFGLLLILIVLTKEKKKLIFSLLFILFIIISFFFPNPFQKIKKDFLVTLDVGQGNCSLLHFKEKNYLIDCADTSYHSVPTSRSIIEPFLARFNIRQLDGIFITHWDKDHCGSLKDLISDLKVGFIASAPCPPPPSDIKDSILKKHIKTLLLKRGDVVDLKEAKLEVIHPDCNSAFLSSDNNLSLVFSILLDEKNILITGDIENDGLKEIFESNIPLQPVDILFVPHHGAKNSLFVPFLNKIPPHVALISAGKNNRFNHPNPSVINYFSSIGSKIVRTDRDGAILITFERNETKIFEYCETPWEKAIFE